MSINRTDVDPRTKEEKESDEQIRKAVEASKELKEKFGLDIDVKGIIETIERTKKDVVPNIFSNRGIMKQLESESDKVYVLTQIENPLKDSNIPNVDLQVVCFTVDK